MSEPHEHSPVHDGYSQLPVPEHGDTPPPEGTKSMVLEGIKFPTLARFLNLIREDSGGPSWPPQTDTIIAARWAPHLEEMEAAVATLSDIAPAPEDTETCEALTKGERGFMYLDSEVQAFVCGEDTVQRAVAARTPELTKASNFLSDFFEAWTYFADDGFDPLVPNGEG